MHESDITESYNLTEAILVALFGRILITSQFREIEFVQIFKILKTVQCYIVLSKKFCHIFEVYKNWILEQNSFYVAILCQRRCYLGMKCDKLSNANISKLLFVNIEQGETQLASCWLP